MFWSDDGVLVAKCVPPNGVDELRDERRRIEWLAGTDGTCVHIAPESAAGGPLALVRDGDLIRLDVAGRRLDLLVAEDELAARRATWRPPASPPARGWGALFARHVTQADQGCDFDFLTGSGAPEPAIH